MRLTLRVFAAAAVLFLIPSLAEAHSPGADMDGWIAGFRHPLGGWDHLLVMIAVGVWAAQQSGAARWRIPLMFVAVMGLGGVAGAEGLSVPFVEPVILVSVIVLSVLVLKGVRLRPVTGLTVVGFFAFFHGYAHGIEMPAAHLLNFGVGFLLATALLHLTGYAGARLAVIAATVAAPSAVFAQEAQTAAATPTAAASGISEIIVYGRQDSLLGIATSATDGTVGATELQQRPIMRTGEILETVPGVIITQHAGGGKANQYFLRGFNLDHGTDFATSLDDMPVNLPSHAHGQGYSDLNILIPELVERVNYQKGVYYAENGDFASAGAAHLESFKVLSQPIAVLEGGMYGYGRIMGAASTNTGAGDILVGAEVTRNDGPWVKPDAFLKESGVVTYSQGARAEGFSFTARGYHGKWDSSDQIAASAVTSGLIPFYGSLDPTTGGNSQRYSLQGEWHRADTDSETKISAYTFYYDLNLFSNFTYFLTDLTHGDQFEQRDKRITSGLQASHTLFDQLDGHDMATTLGLQIRNDDIHTDLYQTSARQRVIKINADDGTLISDITRQDKIVERNLGAYIENKAQWGDHFRTVLGVREDVFDFNAYNAVPANTGGRTAIITSPKLSLIFGPWAQTEIYVQGGLGYHSNDARGVLTKVDPANGGPIEPATPLVRSKGAEIGIRTLAFTGLQSTVSLWWLDLDSELVFSGDGGTTEPSRPSRRYGIEFANYYTPTPWLTADFDVAFSRARFRDVDPAGQEIPEGIESVVSAGVTVHDIGKVFGSMRLRYFGPRALIEDNSFRSGATLLLNGRVGYHLNERWSLTADVFNILDRKDHDIDYAYESRVTPSATAITQIHYHPVEPRQVRVALSAKF